MKHKLKFLIIAAGLGLLFTSCYQEDPGPKQNEQRSFSMVDFDRLEASEALNVSVQQGNIFSVTASGDARNLNDLDIHMKGSTLVMEFNTHHNRQYTTYITITLPALNGFTFSGAVNGQVTGFTQESSRLDISLSGASVAQVDLKTETIYAQVTGASQLRMMGAGKKVDAIVSGASALSAYEFPVEEVRLNVSGASRAKISASQKLFASVSGASEVLYRGSPVLEIDVTGASKLSKD